MGSQRDRHDWETSLFTFFTSSLLWITVLLWQKGLRNSMKLWVMLCRATQDGQVIVESSDKTWSTGGGDGKPPQIFAWRTPWAVWKGKRIWHWKMSPPGWKMSCMLLGKSKGQILIAPERMKWLGQSGNDAQLWMCLLALSKLPRRQWRTGASGMLQSVESQNGITVLESQTSHWMTTTNCVPITVCLQKRVMDLI